MTVPRSSRWRCPPARTVIVIAVVAVVLLLTGVAQTSAGQNAMRSLGLIAPKNTYSELFFFNPQRIASLAETRHHRRRGVWTERAAFVIQNVSTGSIDYRWSALVQGQVRASGHQPLGPGQKITLAPALHLRCRQATKPDPRGPRQLTVTIQLAQPRQSIDYLFNCGG
jgi:hypothetical protein